MSFTIHGVGVSGGIAIGRAQLVSHAQYEVEHYDIPASQVPTEKARFDAAIALYRSLGFVEVAEGGDPDDVQIDMRLELS